MLKIITIGLLVLAGFSGCQEVTRLSRPNDEHRSYSSRGWSSNNDERTQLFHGNLGHGR